MENLVINKEVSVKIGSYSELYKMELIDNIFPFWFAKSKQLPGLVRVFESPLRKFYLFNNL